jgi:sugar transferase (PEP-CTERM system associated)
MNPGQNQFSPATSDPERRLAVGEFADGGQIPLLRTVPDDAFAGTTTIVEPSRRWLKGSRGSRSIRLFGHHVGLPMLLLALTEAAILIGAVYLASYWWFDGNAALIEREIGTVLPRAAVFALTAGLCIVAFGLYNARVQPSGAGTVLRLALSLLVACSVLVILYYFLPAIDLGRGTLGASGIFSLFGLVVARFVFLRTADEVIFRRRILAYGAGKKAASLSSLRVRADLRGFEVVGFVPNNGSQRAVDPESLVEIAPGDLLGFAKANDIDEIVVALDDRRNGLPMEELLACRLHGIPVVDVLTFFERETGKVELSMLYPSWLIFSDGVINSRLKNALERVFDVSASVLLLAVAWPLMAVAAAAIWIESGLRGPILYRQIRAGRQGRPFPVLKFRSMGVDAEANGEAVWAKSEDPRVTRVGRIIRKYRIDELPQLFNVLKGDMSFVGPRPERPEFVEGLEKKIPFYKERHCVKPGITGWAQLCYPYGASENDALEKLQYDLYYVKHRSLLFDLLILLQTAEVILWRRGAR